MKTIDLGGPIRIVVEDFSYGIDELFYQDAANAGIVIAMEDGTDDGDETIDTYLIPTWGRRNCAQRARPLLPARNRLNGTGRDLDARVSQRYARLVPGPAAAHRPASQGVWCKHALSTADWWNVYTDGLGDGSEGFQDTPAVPGATALFRFNQDSDLDGFSDRSENNWARIRTMPASFPQPEVLAGVHNIRAGNR